MITKERLEETIRGVIREFKRTKRIPNPAADELTAAIEARLYDLFSQDATSAIGEVEDSTSYVEDLRHKGAGGIGGRISSGDRGMARNALLVG
jgi:hypothetical protein